MDPFTTPVDSTHLYTDVLSDGYKGVGGAHHRYVITKKLDGEVLGRVSFQDGAIKEAGINGVMDENLMAIVIDRLRGFQAGKYACRENALALTKLEESLMWLKSRTGRRQAEGVEGTHAV